jgi:transposase
MAIYGIIKRNRSDTMARPKIYLVTLKKSEIKKLQSLIRDKKTSKTIIRRCQILLELDSNNPTQLTQLQISKTFGVSKSTVSNVVKKYTQHGLEYTITYQRNPNSNAKRKVDGRSEAHIVELACSAPPDGFSRWTVRLLADRARVVLDTPVSKSTIQEVLKKHNLNLT